MKPADIESENRSIRVFISSTFRDMMREPNLLVKEILPKLRRKCAKRFVTFAEVDLRWEDSFGSIPELKPESMR